jgi:hypothetical protein
MSWNDVNNAQSPLWADTVVAIIEDDAASIAGFAFAGLSFAGGYRRTQVVDTAQWQAVDNAQTPNWQPIS